MMVLRFSFLLLTLTATLLALRPALADGFMLPVAPEQPRFSVTYHHVQVNIDHQVATTDIDQVFHSNARQQIEGTYIFPIADNMTITKFSLYAGSEELAHRVLEKDEARSIYNGIVAKRRDPALLEWLGTRMVKASVFPIQAGEDKRIHIAYQEALAAQGNVVKYVYPLRTEKMSAQPLQDCKVDITLHSAQPLSNIYSPTHNISVTREGENLAHVSYHESNVLPDQDLVLYYTVSSSDLGVDLISYRDPAQGDGYFLLMASPKPDLHEHEVQPKDVVFVLDKSGSMAEDRKLEQAKAALKYCINSLNVRDRFTIVAFNDEVRWWKQMVQTASRENVQDAEAFVNDMQAEGGTNIDQALQTALTALKPAADAPDGVRPASIVFLTDGQPTVGQTDVEQILRDIKTTNSRRVRLFDFGVGNDYNAHFLDKLANENNGSAENVLPGEDLEVKVSNFYAKVATPMLMNLAVDWGGADVYDVSPNALPDLFKGSQLLITGRYKVHDGAVKTTIRLSGDLAGRKQVFEYPVTLVSSSYTDEFIPRLWATRKIGFLEDQMRLNGSNEELLKELIRLSKEYGILTQYTSFLVDTDATAPVGVAGAPGAAARMNMFAKDETAQARYGNATVLTITQQKVGGSAVAQSYNSKAGMNAAQAAPANGNYVINEQGARVQLSQMRNISQRSFVQAGNQWVDVNYKPAQQMVKVQAYSPAYFQLVNSNARMAQYLSMGENVTVMLKGTAIQTGTDGQAELFKPEEYKAIKAKIDAEFGVI